MRTFYITLLSLCLLVLNSATAQDYTFKVLANKGQNSVKSGEAEWKALKTGQALKINDQIKLSEDAYLGLMHKSGKTLEVKTAGTHSVKSLSQKLSGENSSVASKYADFVRNRMAGDEGNENYRKAMGATGAVDRAIKKEASLDLMAFSSTEIINDEVILRWSEPEQEGDKDELTYTITFYNLFDSPIKEVETKETAYELDMSKEPFANLDNNRFVKVKVAVKGTDLTSGSYAITMKPDGEAAEISETLAKLRSELSENSALDNMVIAAFYEDNNLILDALTAYEKALDLAPEVEIYSQAYTDFLERNGFLD